jgi:hypothetical protein
VVCSKKTVVGGQEDDSEVRKEGRISIDAQEVDIPQRRSESEEVEQRLDEDR